MVVGLAVVKIFRLWFWGLILCVFCQAVVFGFLSLAEMFRLWFLVLFSIFLVLFPLLCQAVLVFGLAFCRAVVFVLVLFLFNFWVWLCCD